jgi:hypothetical protein
MRSIFIGIIILSASMAGVHTAQAQEQSQRPPGYGHVQARIGHRQPTQDDLQPTQDDLKNIQKDNQDLELPASQDDLVGAGQVHSTPRKGTSLRRSSGMACGLIVRSKTSVQPAEPTAQQPEPQVSVGLRINTDNAASTLLFNSDQRL